MALAMVALACGPMTPPVAADSVVLMMCGKKPCCNAVVAGPPGMLMTAAHCVEATGAGVGGYVDVIPRGSWYAVTIQARVIWLDADRDIAVLRAPGLPGLPVGPAPGFGEHVHAVSAYYSWGTLDGVALESAGDYVTSNLDVVPGWSGSPVLDTKGRVVGIVISCNAAPGTRKACVPRTGNIARLP